MPVELRHLDVHDHDVGLTVHRRRGRRRRRCRRRRSRPGPRAARRAPRGRSGGRPPPRHGCRRSTADSVIGRLRGSQARDRAAGGWTGDLAAAAEPAARLAEPGPGRTPPGRRAGRRCCRPRPRPAARAVRPSGVRVETDRRSGRGRGGRRWSSPRPRSGYAATSTAAGQRAEVAGDDPGGRVEPVAQPAAARRRGRGRRARGAGGRTRRRMSATTSRTCRLVLPICSLRAGRVTVDLQAGRLHLEYHPLRAGPSPSCEVAPDPPTLLLARADQPPGCPWSSRPTGWCGHGRGLADQVAEQLLVAAGQPAAPGRARAARAGRRGVPVGDRQAARLGRAVAVRRRPAARPLRSTSTLTKPTPKASATPGRRRRAPVRRVGRPRSRRDHRRPRRTASRAREHRPTIQRSRCRRTDRRGAPS